MAEVVIYILKWRESAHDGDEDVALAGD